MRVLVQIENWVVILNFVKQEFSGWPCSVARGVAVFGDAWTLMILRDCMHGVTRFDEFQKSLQIARNTLSDRLSGLVDTGVLTKRFYQDNPPRYEYLLTDMGRDLFPVISAMLAWGDKWLDAGEGAPVRLHHEMCNHDLEPQVVCKHCGEPIHAADVQFCVGPGFPETVECGTDFRHRLAESPGADGGRPHRRERDAAPASRAAAHGSVRAAGTGARAHRATRS